MSETIDIPIEEQAAIYAFLKVVFVTEPSLELLQCLRAPEILKSFQFSGVDLDIGSFDESQLSKLIEDYTQLFIGPKKHISLNESIYTDRTPRFWGESTVVIKKLIGYIGLELDEHWKQMPDHISVEFELMQKLLEAKQEALTNQQDAVADQCTQAINGLYHDHIIKWVPKVCDQVIEKAQTSVYKAIGIWTKACVQFSQ